MKCDDLNLPASTIQSFSYRQNRRQNGAPDADVQSVKFRRSRGPHIGLQILKNSTHIENYSVNRPSDHGDGPIFMVGSARSGTTLLRNILRSHDNLVCPEETHFYRWAEAFGSNRFSAHLINSKVLQKHRKIDGISEDEFKVISKKATSKKDLMTLYMHAFMKSNSHKEKRWFDKTPQNVYGLPLIVHDFPNAQYIHLVRHPYNVVASLIEGKAIKSPDVFAAANFWNEAVSIVNTMRQLLGPRLHELKYEDLLAEPREQLAKLAGFIGVENAFGKNVIRRIRSERAP